jgi:Zn-dependent M28 family amino/carboxypeptidase
MAKFILRVVRVFLLAGVGLGLVLATLGIALVQPTFSASPFMPKFRADAALLRGHVEKLTGEFLPRSTDDPESLNRAADYIEAEFRSGTGRVEEQTYVVRGESFRNIIVSFGPEAGRRWIIGAHYDAYSLSGINPGADDNASGTAGLLELSRLLSAETPRSRVDLVAFTNEEPPFYASPQMGSAVYVAELQGQETAIELMICLEMIGYFTPEQPWPNPFFQAIYPNEGDFIAVAGRWSERRWVRQFKRALRGAGQKTSGFAGPALIAGLDASDHRNFWAKGYAAILVTDTAFLRNPNYHTENDTAATLDYSRMATVVDGLNNALRQFRE